VQQNLALEVNPIMLKTTAQTLPCALPVHPRTGLSAIGLLDSGKPVWPVMGASPDDPSNSGATAVADTAAAAGAAQVADTAAQAATAASHATTTAATTAATETKRTLESSLAALDEDTRKYVLGEVSKARGEAGAARTAAKQTAAEEARSEMAQTIGKALGLIKEDEKLDPAKLTEQLTGAQAQIKQTQVELAVYQAAADAGAKANALLDSRSFLTKISALEPGDTAGITAAINEAVAANPAFAAASAVAEPVDPNAPTVPKPNPAQGSSGSGAPSIDDQIAAATKDGNLRLALHLQNQKLLPSGR
jgi:hypothetical protein